MPLSNLQLDPDYLCQGGYVIVLVTSSIAGSAKRYLSYSEADFQIFRPAGATRCTDGGEIWHGPLVHSSVPVGAMIGI